MPQWLPFEWSLWVCTISCHFRVYSGSFSFPTSAPLTTVAMHDFFPATKVVQAAHQNHFSQMNASRYVLSNWLILTMSTDLIAFLHNDLICKSLRHARDSWRLGPKISRFVSRAVIWPRHAKGQVRKSLWSNPSSYARVIQNKWLIKGNGLNMSDEGSLQNQHN